MISSESAGGGWVCSVSSGASRDNRPSRIFGLLGVSGFCVVSSEEWLLLDHGFQVVEGLSSGLMDGAGSV